MTDLYLWSDLLDCLELDATAEGFEGRNLRLDYHRLFGGQLLGQFARAATLTCPDKTVKSLHVLFPREGRSHEPLRYEVERLHEGGTFATLTITAKQERGVIAAAAVSLHAAEQGLNLQADLEPPPVPGVEQQRTIGLLPWETRSATDLDSPLAVRPEYDLWMRTPTPTDPDLAPALTAYASDLNLIGTALQGVSGLSQSDAGTAFQSAVTSHTVWFHRPFRTDDWLLLRHHAPVLAHGRSFGRGDVLTARGSLVASFSQEALLRFWQ